MELQKSFILDLELSAFESFSIEDDILLNKLKLMENTCTNEFFIIEILEIIRKGKRTTSITSINGTSIISIEFLARCYSIKQLDVIPVKIDKIEYNNYYCKAPYIEATITPKEKKYKVGEVILLIVYEITYGLKNISIIGEDFLELTEKTYAVSVFDTKKVPLEILEALERVKEKINFELKNKSKSFDFYKKKFFTEKKFKSKMQNALKPVFEDQEKLWFVYSYYSPLEEFGYYLLPFNNNLKEFGEITIYESGESHYYWVLNILENNLVLLKCLNNCEKIENL